MPTQAENDAVMYSLVFFSIYSTLSYSLHIAFGDPFRLGPCVKFTVPVFNDNLFNTQKVALDQIIK